MAAYETLRAAIDSYIKANGNKEITGIVLNDILNAMVSALGADTRFAGVAVPSTNPGNPEGNVVYFASQAGTYSNFGGIVLPFGIHILVWNGTAWTSQTWFSVNNTPTQNSQNLVTSGGIFQAIVDAVGVERLRAIGAEVTSCSFNSTTKKISFFNSANSTLFKLDATAFIIDGMVSDVKIEDGNLVIKFNTDAGKQDIEIPLTEIFDPANYYTKTAINALLTAINNKLADGCLYRGMAEPTTNPPTPTTKVFYIATKAGTYTNFGNISVTEGITILKYDGSSWSKEQISYSDGVFDISAYNGTSYEDLSAALGTNGANIPQNLRKGGMSVKFVQSSDNKYVQYRLMSDEWSTTVSDWQGVDDEPTAGSDNLVKSRGTYKSIKYEDRRISLLNGMDISKDIKVGWYLSDGTYTGNDGKRIDGINVVAGEIIQYFGSYGAACKGILCFNSAGTIIDMLEKENLGDSYIEYTVPSNAAYIKVCSFSNYLTVKIKDNISDKVRSLYSTSKITINNGIPTATTWSLDGSRHKHIVVNVSDMQVERYEVKCNSTQFSSLAFLSSYVPPMSPYVPISFVGTIDNSLIPLPINGGVLSGNIPSGTKYIVFSCVASGVSCTPQYLLIDGYDITKEIIANIPLIKKGLETKIADINERYDKTIKTNIQFNESSITKDALPLISDGKSLDPNGTLFDNANGVRTDFIKISNNTEIVYEGQYGGYCAMCQFFDSEYNFISAITQPDLAYMEQKVIIPYNAVYARFCSFNEHGEGLKVTLNPIYIKFSNNEQLNCLLKEVYISGIYLSNRTVRVSVWNNYYNTALNKYIVGIAILGLNGEDFYCTRDFITEDDADTFINANPIWCYHLLKSTSNGYLYYEITAKVDLNYLNKGEYVTFDNVRIDDFIVKNPEKPNITKEIKPIKRILWLGTSIPTGGYPNYVGKMLGCTIYNEALGESLCRLGWGADCIAAGDTIDIWGCNVDTHAWNPASNTITALAKSLSATVAEKQYLINNLSHFEEITHNTLDRNLYTDAMIYSFSYENKILKYVDSSRNDYTPVDLIVFDHGHNDLNPDGVPAWDTISIDSTDKSNYYGAMNFLISQIRKYASNIPICQISHYFGNEDYQHSYMGTPQFAWEAQKKMADYNGIAYFDFYKYTGISTLRRTYTSGYWDQGCIWHDSGLIFQQNQDGTYTTNSYTIAKDFGFDGTWSNGLFTSNATTLPQNVINKNITMEDNNPYYNLKAIEVAMPDALHPSSDMSQYCNKKFGAIIAGWLDKTYCIK